jgi:hypothetical protein
VIRRLFALIILLAVFTGGYHLGRQPESPDLIGGARSAGRALWDAGVVVADAVDQMASAAGFHSEPEPETQKPETGISSSPTPTADNPGD